jgi:hypothetical protein
MVKGFIIDRGDHNAVTLPAWTEGMPEKKWYGLRAKGEKLPTTTYRCPRCGLLQWYAQPNE